MLPLHEIELEYVYVDREFDLLPQHETFARILGGSAENYRKLYQGE